MVTQTIQASQRSTKAIHIALWCLQVLLAALFLMSGAVKAFTPWPELVQRMAWVTSFTPGVIHFIGWCEILGAIGLIVPAATRIQPLATAWAGTGLATVMLCAALFHLSRREFQMLPIVVVIGVACVFVSWGRFRRAPIPPRELAPPRSRTA